MAQIPSQRITVINDSGINHDGEYVLYWMIANRRTRWNFALEHAIAHARVLRRPLLVLEALRCNYPWASQRFHQFIIEGMLTNAKRLRRKGIRYYPYVEQSRAAGHGLMNALGKRACVVVTDRYPAFFLPRMVAAAGKAVPQRLEAVDANGLLPMSAADTAYPTAYAFRRFLQKTLPDHLSDTPSPDPLKNSRLPDFIADISAVEKRWPPLSEMDPRTIRTLLQSLPIDQRVSVSTLRGGEVAASDRLQHFIEDRLDRYGAQRNSIEDDATSGLSPYLHFGHISAHEVFEAVMSQQEWSASHTFPKAKGSRSGWWGVSESAEGFLDQLITWRELGFNMCQQRDDYDLYSSLPAWARATLDEHREDYRPYTYDLSALESADTHDPLWNAAQCQLVEEGRIHNYLRMLWGKKILEWSRSPEEALVHMVELNNKYAIDGRDPNSYSGIFWCLGRYDRAWGPERPIFGKIRYMSSDNTARKIKVKGYLERFSG